MLRAGRPLNKLVKAVWRDASDIRARRCKALAVLSWLVKNAVPTWTALAPKILAARAERPLAHALQHHGAKRRVDTAAVDDVVELASRLTVYGVKRFRPVERDPSDVVAYREVHELVDHLCITSS